MAYASKSILFGGTDEYITMGDVLGFEYTDSFSFSAWAKCPTITSTHDVIAKYLGSPTYEGIQFAIDASGGGNGRLYFFLCNTYTGLNYIEVVSDAINLKDGRWHHVAVTFNGTTAAGVSLYLDGILQNKTINKDTLNATVITTAPFCIGGNPNNISASSFFVGNIDEVSVYNKALTAAEVFWIYNGGNPRDLYSFGAPSNLVAWWRMGDGDATGTNNVLDLGPGAVYSTVKDLSGNNYTGTMTNMESGDIVTDSPGGYFAKKSLLFGGTDEYVTMGNVLAYERTQAFTISAWIKTSIGVGVGGTIAGKWQLSAPSGYVFQVDVDRLRFGMVYTYNTNGFYLGATATGVNNGQWHHVVVTYSGNGSATGAKFYMDGSLLTNETPAFNNLVSSVVNSCNFQIGKDSSGADEPFIGNIDEAAVHDKVLSATEIKWIYNNGAPRNLKDSNAPTNLVGWWRMGEGAYSGTMTNMESGDIVIDAPARIYYSMRAIDDNARTTPATYRTWTAVNNPDYGISQYTGPFSALNAYTPKSVAFGGTNECVAMGDVCSFERTDSFSISCWIKYSTSTATFVAKEAVSTYAGYELYSNGGNIRFWLGNNYGTGNYIIVGTASAYGDGNWHHVVATYDGSSTAAGCKIYIDGVSQSLSTISDNLTASILNTASFTLGGWTYFMTGSLDEVAVYNKTLSASEVSWIYNGNSPRDLLASGAPSNLVGWWRMGEGDTYPYLLDSSGNNYTGGMTNMESGDIETNATGPRSFSSAIVTNTNEPITYYVMRAVDDNARTTPPTYRIWTATIAPDYTASQYTGPFSALNAYTPKSVVFNGSDDYVTMGNVLDFDRTSVFSFSFWFKVTTTGGMIIAKCGLGTPAGWNIYVLSGSIYLEMTVTYPTNYLSVNSNTTSITTGQWYHGVVTYAGNSLASGVEFYINGVSQAKNVNYNTLSSSIANSFNLTLARRMISGSEVYFDGNLDEVSVYNKVLSSTEVSWIYNGNSPRDLYASGSPPNLIAWWRMGEGDVYPTLLDSGLSAVHPTVNDLSGNSYSGTMTNMEVGDIVSDVPGKSVFSMKSVLFEGTDEYVDCGNILGFERTSPFSVSFWIKYVGSGGSVITKMDNLGIGWMVETASILSVALLNSFPSNCAYVTIPCKINDGFWHHCVITVDGSSSATGIYGYVDGVSYAPSILYDTLTSSILNSVSTCLGRRIQSGYPNYFTGNLDEVAVYNKALSAAEASWIYNGGSPRSLSISGCPSNLVTWWKMGDGDTFSTLIDSGSGYNGTMSNMESTDIRGDSPYRGTFAQNSLLFGGTNEYVTMGNVLAFERTDAFSISFWFKTASTAGCTLLCKMDGSTTYRGYTCFIGATGLISLMLRSDNATTNMIRVDSNTSGYNDNNWHHLVWSYSGSSTAAGNKLYIDGASITLSTITDALTATISSSAAFALGIRVADSASPYTGNLDEVSVYNKELISTEVTWIYNSGIPKNLKDTGAPSNLVAWWRLGEGAYPGTMTSMATGSIETNATGPKSFSLADIIKTS